MTSSDDNSDSFYEDSSYIDSDSESFYSTTSEDYESDSIETTDQPVHFRECLRLLDAALTTNQSFSLPQWCGSEKVHMNDDDPQVSIGNYPQTLHFPFDKRAAHRIIHEAQPLSMNTNIIDHVSFSAIVYKLPSDAFNINNIQWKSQLERCLKESCIHKTLQIDPNHTELKISSLLLLESCRFPQEFPWTEDDGTEGVIAKLFISLPSIYKGGRETITHIKEKHVFDRSTRDSRRSIFWTLVPFTNECKYEIDLISNGYKFILVYDIIIKNQSALYHIRVNETILERMNGIFDKWMYGLQTNMHGYASKIIVPFTDFFKKNSNILLYGLDRMIGTILYQTVMKYHHGKFLLYSATIRPNRSINSNEHLCRSIVDLKLLNDDSHLSFFRQIQSCTGNCNETFSGNIFIRRTLSERNNPITIERYDVPVWCIVPITHKYELFLEKIPLLMTFLEKTLIPSVNHSQEVFHLIEWLLTTPKKVSLNTKAILHQLIRLTNSHELSDDLELLITKLLYHKKFAEQFHWTKQTQDLYDIVQLLKLPQKVKFQIAIHQTTRLTMKRFINGDNVQLKEMIKFIGVLAANNINKNFVFVLVHELLQAIFRVNSLKLSLTDLIDLLALLATFYNVYERSCEIISKEIIRQMNLTKLITNSSTTSNQLRELLVTTLIYICRNWIHVHSNNASKEKRQRTVVKKFPNWFISLYETCLSILDSYCRSCLPIPLISTANSGFQRCDCSTCDDLFSFLENTSLLQQTLLISVNEIDHFRMIAYQFNPISIHIESMTPNRKYQKLTIVKISDCDEEEWRRNNLFYSLLGSIYCFNDDDASDTHLMIQKKRRKFTA